MGKENTDPVKAYKPVQFDDAKRGKKGLDRSALTDEEKERLKALEEEGREKGYAAGYAKGVGEGEKNVSDACERFGGIIRELEDFKEKKVEELMPEIMELSLEIAKKVVHREIELDRTVIRDVAGDAIRRVGEGEDTITIKINPSDYEVMLANLDFLKEKSGLKDIIIEPTASISPGGCYIETRTGEIDARIEEQIKEIEDAVRTASDS